MAEAKTPRDSQVITRHLVMPQHANPNKTLFGGQLVSWIDLVASMAATRHCGMTVVTASIDEISFHAPIMVADQILLEARVNYVGRTSMEIGVKVSVEEPISGTIRQVTRAYLTFVAMDENCRPAPVPRLKIETEEEKRRHDRALVRVEHRKELRQKLDDELKSR